ncbi:hypothetical protein LY78DRAFT_674265 [Colletotrichum sublineola]|nr:hypothetical protein LY78DRAFT_674265 [Colletotrichum sublineola]
MAEQNRKSVFEVFRFPKCPPEQVNAKKVRVAAAGIVNALLKREFCQVGIAVADGRYEYREHSPRRFLLGAKSFPNVWAHLEHVPSRFSHGPVAVHSHIKIVVHVVSEHVTVVYAGAETVSAMATGPAETFVLCTGKTCEALAEGRVGLSCRSSARAVVLEGVGLPDARGCGKLMKGTTVEIRTRGDDIGAEALTEESRRTTLNVGTTRRQVVAGY